MMKTGHIKLNMLIFCTGTLLLLFVASITSFRLFTSNVSYGQPEISVADGWLRYAPAHGCTPTALDNAFVRVLAQEGLDNTVYISDVLYNPQYEEYRIIYANGTSYVYGREEFHMDIYAYFHDVLGR